MMKYKCTGNLLYFEYLNINEYIFNFEINVMHNIYRLRYKHTIVIEIQF